MENHVIFTGKGARLLSQIEMKHVLAGSFQDSFGWVHGRDLTACNNKKCKDRSDCGTAVCASMECNNVKEYHCV